MNTQLLPGLGTCIYWCIYVLHPPGSLPIVCSSVQSLAIHYFVDHWLRLIGGPVGCGSWEEFRARVDEREPRMLRAFTAMEVNPAGSLEVAEIQSES